MRSRQRYALIKSVFERRALEIKNDRLHYFEFAFFTLLAFESLSTAPAARRRPALDGCPFGRHTHDGRSDHISTNWSAVVYFSFSIPIRITVHATIDHRTMVHHRSLVNDVCRFLVRHSHWNAVQPLSSRSPLLVSLVVVSLAQILIPTLFPSSSLRLFIVGLLSFVNDSFASRSFVAFVSGFNRKWIMGFTNRSINRRFVRFSLFRQLVFAFFCLFVCLADTICLLSFFLFFCFVFCFLLLLLLCQLIELFFRIFCLIQSVSLQHLP